MFSIKKLTTIFVYIKLNTVYKISFYICYCIACVLHQILNIYKNKFMRAYNYIQFINKQNVAILWMNHKKID